MTPALGISNERLSEVPGMTATPHSQPPFSTRTAVLLIIAALAGVTVGGLTFQAGKPVAAAILAGLVAAGSALLGANALISRDSD